MLRRLFVKSFFPAVLSILAIFLLWEIFARLINAPLILPLPREVFVTLLSLCRTAIFWKNIGATFLRVIISFAISVALGTFVGALCGSFRFAQKFFDVPLAVIRATPVVAFILLALFWFDSTTIPIFVSVLMALPVVVSGIATGFHAGQKQLYEMACVYAFTKRQQLMYITLPAVKPFFLNVCVASFGLSWKVVAAGEVLSLPKKGAGTLLQTAQVHLETRQVMAVTIMLVVLSFALEKLFAFFVKVYMGKRNG